ncbi:ATP-binding protein [Streptomyces sp. NPDC004779]
MANADQHATGGPWELHLSKRGERLYISVRDACPRSSVPSVAYESCADPERGRGLEIVRALVDEVGCHRSEAGKTVWAWVGVVPPAVPSPAGRLRDARPLPARVQPVRGSGAQEDRTWRESVVSPAAGM